MYNLHESQGRVQINMIAVTIGDDLCVIISGGDKPHIGCVTLSAPRPSLSDPDNQSATTSVLNLLGHKDDEPAKFVSHELSSRLGKNVVVTCGIHLDNITVEEIKNVMKIITKLTNLLIAKVMENQI